MEENNTPKVAFFDPVCPKPYSRHTLDTEPMGGTEATVVRVAEALGASVLQHNRFEPEGRYLPPDSPIDVTHVVSIRGVEGLQKLVYASPDARRYLWLHDVVTDDLAANRSVLEALKPIIITVSYWHQENVKAELVRLGLTNLTVMTIYNPVCIPDLPVGYDPTKLIFFSSPHKGLENTLEVFAALHKARPEFTLYIANPGYLKDPEGLDRLPGVRVLGPKAHQDVLKHVKSSLAVFYLNNVFPETFGLVFAEADALGTPVITYGRGAAKEVLWHPQELISSPQEAIDRVLDWHKGNRPNVKSNPAFSMSEVVARWKRILSLF